MIKEKYIILASFLRNINAWQRRNVVGEECHDLLWTKDGNYKEGSQELHDYLNKLEARAVEIENEPRDYSSLFEVDNLFKNGEKPCR